MKNTDFGTEALVERYPNWEKQIRQGDLKMSWSKKGALASLVVEWANSKIFGPSGHDLVTIMRAEGISECFEWISAIETGSVSLSITFTTVSH
jgi:hypothetical protein